MNKESKLNLNAGDYAISHCDSDKTYNGLEVHKMLCDAYIAGSNDTFDDEAYRKAYYDGYNSCNRDWIHSQEDEKIRKALIDFFGKGAKNGEQTNGVYDKDILSWLERQGGEKDSLSIDFVLGYLGIKPAYKDGNAWCILLGDNIQEGICGFGDTKEEALIAFMKELIEKQGKQVEKKASFTTIVETGDGGINALVTRELPTDGEQKSVEENKGNIGGISSNSERSVEDMSNVQRICKYLNEAKKYYADITEVRECIDWLHSLQDRLQPKQEWSEEDINMIDWLIRCCEEEHKELCNDKYGHQDIVSDLKRDCRKKWDWLESLKNRVAPQNNWKPSDNELEVLRLVAEKDGTCLMGLYEQLKKLKEE